MVVPGSRRRGGRGISAWPSLFPSFFIFRVLRAALHLRFHWLDLVYDRFLVSVFFFCFRFEFRQLDSGLVSRSTSFRLTVILFLSQARLSPGKTKIISLTIEFERKTRTRLGKHGDVSFIGIYWLSQWDEKNLDIFLELGSHL